MHSKRLFTCAVDSALTFASRGERLPGISTLIGDIETRPTQVSAGDVPPSADVKWRYAPSYASSTSSPSATSSPTMTPAPSRRSSTVRTATIARVRRPSTSVSSAQPMKRARESSVSSSASAAARELVTGKKCGKEKLHRDQFNVIERSREAIAMNYCNYHGRKPQMSANAVSSGLFFDKLDNNIGEMALYIKLLQKQYEAALYQDVAVNPDSTLPTVRRMREEHAAIMHHAVETRDIYNGTFLEPLEGEEECRRDGKACATHCEADRRQCKVARIQARFEARVKAAAAYMRAAASAGRPRMAHRGRL